MAFKTPVLDRVPTYPGRVKLTPVAGATNTYDMVRADSPIEEGTPLNKALLDQKAYTLTQDVTVYVDGAAGNDTTGDGTSAMPFATIQKAADSLPKWLDGYTATISITAGTYEERVVLNGFQGGALKLGTSNRSVTVRGVQIDACSMVHIDVNITRSSLGGTPLNIKNGSDVVFVGDRVIDGGSANVSGVVVESGSTLSSPMLASGAARKTTINNCKYYGIYATESSRVSLGELAGSGNGVGLYVTDGSVASYHSYTMTAGTGGITASGGRIYGGAQIY